MFCCKHPNKYGKTLNSVSFSIKLHLFNLNTAKKYLDGLVRGKLTRMLINPLQN